MLLWGELRLIRWLFLVKLLLNHLNTRILSGMVKREDGLFERQSLFQKATHPPERERAVHVLIINKIIHSVSFASSDHVDAASWDPWDAETGPTATQGKEHQTAQDVRMLRWHRLLLPTTHQGRPPADWEVFPRPLRRGKNVHYLMIPGHIVIGNELACFHYRCHYCLWSVLPLLLL